MTNSDKIREYMQHKERCAVNNFDEIDGRIVRAPGECTCGLAEALKLLSSPPIVGVEPVAMIHNDYDCSVTCSRCGTDGGFSMYDDLDWAKFCPGCGGPISEQVSAKGERTPHPLYLSAQAPQSSPAPVMSREQLTQEAHGYALKHFTKHGYPRQDIVAELASFGEHVLSLSPAPSYAMSKDYDALYEHLKAGGEALGWDSSRHRTVYFLCREGERVCVRGEKYFKGFIESPLAFIAECTHLNLEWLAPAQGVMPQVDKIMEVVKPYMQSDSKYWMQENENNLRSRLSALLKLPQ